VKNPYAGSPRPYTSSLTANLWGDMMAGSFKLRDR
jgi:hypothetical protein